MRGNGLTKKISALNAVKHDVFRNSDIKTFEPFVLETDRKSYITLKGNIRPEICENDRAVIYAEGFRVEIKGAEIHLEEISCFYAEFSGIISEISFY